MRLPPNFPPEAFKWLNRMAEDVAEKRLTEDDWFRLVTAMMASLYEAGRITDAQLDAFPEFVRQLMTFSTSREGPPAKTH